MTLVHNNNYTIRLVCVMFFFARKIQIKIIVFCLVFIRRKIISDVISTIFKNRHTVIYCIIDHYLKTKIKLMYDIFQLMKLRMYITHHIILFIFYYNKFKKKI